MKYEHEVRIIKIAKFIFHPCMVAIPSFYILGLWESVMVSAIVMSWALYNVEIDDCNQDGKEL